MKIFFLIIGMLGAITLNVICENDSSNIQGVSFSGSQPISVVSTLPLVGGSTTSLSTAVPTTGISNDPVLTRGNIILGKWISLIEQNSNEPNKITQPSSVIDDDTTVIEGLLQAHKNLPEATRQQYLLLLDLFKLAQIRNFNNGLKDVENRYGDSITAQEKEGYFEVKNRDARGAQKIYGAKWYQDRLEELQELLSYFTKSVLPKIGATPPPLLTGIHETISQGTITYQQYKQFYECMENPSTSQCRAFINIMRAQGNKPSSLPSDEIQREMNYEENDSDN